MAEPETPQKAVKRATKAAATPGKGKASTKSAAPAKPRKSTYSLAVAQSICEQLSEGVPLREICRQPGMPAWRTVYDWMYQDADLATAIAHARDLGYDAIAEDCLRIADTPEMGQKQVMGDEGATVTVEDMLGHRKLRIETRLKLLAKFNPKKYGDKVSLAGDAENPIRVEAESQADRLFAELLKNLELRRLESSRS